jgi:hypothetical protein
MNGIPSKLVKINQLFIIGTVLAALLINYLFLLLPLFVGVITIMTKKNPIISYAKRFLKNDLSSYTLEDGEQQIFNQWIATILLTLQFISFIFSYNIVAFRFGLVVITACSFAFAGYCIGCVVRYRYLKWKYNRIKIDSYKEEKY